MREDTIQQRYSNNVIKKLIEECRFEGSYDEWKAARSFVGKAIHKKGTLIDLGCANGFFLRCLQDWQPYDLDVYGIDNREEAISEARNLFPDKTNHFQIISGADIYLLYEDYDEQLLPSKYDFVYRNYWRNELNSEENLKEEINKLLPLVRDDGRLILGIYAGSDIKIESHPHMMRWVENMKKAAGRVDGEAYAETGGSLWIMWIDVVATPQSTSKTTHKSDPIWGNFSSKTDPV
ncbi:MAG: class I SAM-dependent methyltransferase [Candidatus Peregrinibacteria bacterium]|nr:class I SAM-dependent methyltransferase [Candidatus Peregrinibacteria bacterium]